MDAADLNSRLSRHSIQRICVIKPSAFGDVVQALPVLNALRARFPDSEISWVINRELSELLTGHSAHPELIPFDRRGGISAWWTLLRKLRASRFDLVLDLQGLLRTGVMAWVSGAPWRVGLQTAREGSRFACHVLLPNSGTQVPAHQRYWAVAKSLAVGHLSRQAEVAVPSIDVAWAKRLKAHLTGPLLIIHPGARWTTKCWPIAHFSQVAKRVLSELGMSAIVIGSRGEAPAADELVRTVKCDLPRGEIISLAGQTSIKQLAALMQNADLVLSNDSGPMHLAAAMGAPVVGLFTCTKPERSGPPGFHHRLIAANVPCAGSYCKQCPQSGANKLACFRELTPDRVWEALRSHWEQISRSRRVA